MIDQTETDDEREKREAKLRAYWRKTAAAFEATHPIDRSDEAIAHRLGLPYLRNERRDDD